MEFEEALTAELSTIPEISGRIWPMNVPEGTQAPYLFYLYQGGGEVKDLSGYTGLVNANYEVNVVAKSYAQLRSITKKVNQKMKSFQSRSIGDGSLFIQDFTYEEPVEIRENLVSLCRSYIQISVSYGRD